VDQAKGYGLLGATVVVARKFGRQSSDLSSEQQAPRRDKWHVLSGEPQTDERFDQELVDRMGADVYQRLFGRAVAAAREQSDRAHCRGSPRASWMHAVATCHR